VGRRSRSRGVAARPASSPARRARVGETLTAVRRTLVRYLAGATAVSVITVLGIAMLGGSFGPFIVVAVVVVAGGLLHRWAQGALAGEALGDEDRMIQTAAGGMLLLSALLAVASAVLVSVL